MFPWTFWIIVFICGLFVAVVMTRIIMGPIKRRKSDKQWAEWKRQNEVLKPGFW